MDDSSERMRILDLIDSGQISAEDGLRQLAALQDEPVELKQTGDRAQEAAISEVPNSAELELIDTDAKIDSTVTVIAAESNLKSVPSSPKSESAGSQPLQPEIVSDTQREDFERWKRYWMIPLWIGVGITILGGFLMYWALQSAHVGFWFFCATLPFIFGVIVLALAAGSRKAHWLHLRVQQAPGERPQRIAISFPIPIGLTVWFFRTFRGVIPGLENVPVNLEDVLEAMRDSTSSDQPIYIRVDEEENGEKVEIFIG